MTQDTMPKSSDPMVRKLSEFLEADLKTRSEVFCIQNEPLRADEVASHDGLLALFLYKAAEICDEAQQKKMPLSFESNNSALIDVVPLTDATDVNLFSLWAHYLHYSVEEEIRRIKKEKKLVNGLVPLDGLFQRWHQAIIQKKYTVKPAARPQVGAAQAQNA